MNTATAGMRASATAQRTILAVEDDAGVRGLVQILLKQQGYRVLMAEDADSALALWREHADEVELVFTDIVMPGSLNGLELGQRLLQDRADLKIIYTSGVSVERFGFDIELQEGVNYLPKPYRAVNLKQIVSQAMESQASSPVVG